jgi:hypothetical protein
MADAPGFWAVFFPFRSRSFLRFRKKYPAPSSLSAHPSGGSLLRARRPHPQHNPTSIHLFLVFQLFCSTMPLEPAKQKQIGIESKRLMAAGPRQWSSAPTVNPKLRNLDTSFARGVKESPWRHGHWSKKP